MRRSLAALATAPAILALTPNVLADDAFLTPHSDSIEVFDRPSARVASLVTIDTHTLVAARTAVGDRQDRFAIDLHAIPAALMVERVERRPNGTTSLFARVNASPDSHAVITVFEDAVSARIEHPDLGTFVIEPTGMHDAQNTRLHQLIEVDPTAFDLCASNEAPADGPWAEAGGAPRGVSVIDQLVVYTPNVRNTLGGTAGAFVFCQNAVDLTNQTYMDSGIDNVVVNMVHVHEAQYTESGNTGTDLNRLRNGNDGFFDEVPTTLRNAVGADNIAMIVNGASNACGSGYLNPSSANSAFSVSARGCAIGNLTFPHEVGHNMGCAHDRAAASSGWFSYSFGHVFNQTNGALRRTIMGTSSGSRIARFSNPDITFGGTPTGVPIGDPQAAHNAETHRQTGSLMAGHRNALGCSPFVLTADPIDTSACVGADVSLSVSAFEADPGTVDYQWRFNGMNVPGATAGTLVISAAQPADSGLYDCVLSNECVSVTSQPALVSFSSAVFTLSPQSQTANEGDIVTFEAGFADAGAQLFWEKDGEFLLEGLGSDTLVLENVATDDAGVYVCLANTACGVTGSDPATLTISGGPCGPADLAEPFGALDFTDVIAFLAAFGASDSAADLAEPFGTLDFSDVIAFLASFGAGCP